MNKLVLFFLSIAIGSLPAALFGEDLKYHQAEVVNINHVQLFDGIAQAVNRSTISAQTSGQIVHIGFDVDDYVEKGAVVIRLNDNQQQAALNQATAALKAAQAQYRDAQDRFSRGRLVLDRGAISQAEMDQISAAYDAAQANVDSALAALSQAREQLNYTTIRAPYTGIVTKRHVELGELASPGQPLMSGVSLEKLRINVEIPQSLIPKIRSNPRGFIITPDGKKLYTSRLTVFPYADKPSNTFSIRLEFNNPINGLFPGMFVKAGFIIGRKKVLAIPLQAVVYRSEVTGVYILNDNDQLSLRHIRVGRRLENDKIAILAGLEPGEKVALDPIRAGVALKHGRNPERGNE